MMGRPKSFEPKLFYTQLNLADRIGPDHPLRRIKQLVDFGFVRGRVRALYGYNGHESLDPALTLKLMFLGFYDNVRSERELLRVLPLRIDWLWFCDLDLDDPIPHHSVLSKARRRWGVKVFEEIFAEVLRLCVKAGLVDGGTVYADSTLLKANACVDSRVPRWFWNQLEDTAEQCDDADEQDGGGPPRTPAAAEDTQAAELPAPPQGKFNRHTVSTTDPDAATVARRGREVKLGHRDHSLVDGRHGVLLATIATPADYDDGALLGPLLAKQKKYLGCGPRRVVGDSAYGTRENLESLRSQGIRPYLKRRAGGKSRPNWLEDLPEECDPREAASLMRRRLHTSEGRFAEAHVRYDHRRCRWRRRWRVQVQCYLVGMVQNIGKLLRYGRWPRRALGQLAGIFGRISKLPGVFAAALDRLADLRGILPILPARPRKPLPAPC